MCGDSCVIGEDWSKIVSFSFTHCLSFVFFYQHKCNVLLLFFSFFSFLYLDTLLPLIFSSLGRHILLFFIDTLINE